jgi:hypothetical protein
MRVEGFALSGLSGNMAGNPWGPIMAVKVSTARTARCRNTGRRPDEVLRLNAIRRRAGLLALLATAVLCYAADRGPERELIRDRDLRRGFSVLRPEPGKRVACGVVRGHDTASAPVWDLDFGIPIYDDRHRVVPSHKAQDICDEPGTSKT